MKPITFFTAAALSLTLALPAMAACSDPARPGVDWSGCNKAATDLGYVDLSHADLSYADLHGARLDRTKWTDGRRCAVGSTGVCY